MRLIFVNGCFDILHRGHIELFKYAKSLGTKLIVAIDSDQRVNQMKGKDRPFNHQEDRKFVLESICYIDEVVIFNDEEELENLTYTYKPDIMVVGSDWNGKKVVGSQHAKQIKFFERIEGYSTTKILQGSSDR
jgi:D-beta-D-heptose 7-phosphate kinase/D-beta-D-heptose 1-phosphate adenosyltransferase